MEDWEQFFVEKSRGRADKEPLAQSRRRTQALVAAGLIAALIAAGIAGLALR